MAPVALMQKNTQSQYLTALQFAPQAMQRNSKYPIPLKAAA